MPNACPEQQLPLALLTIPAGALVPVILWSVWTLDHRVAGSGLRLGIHVPHQLAGVLSRRRRPVDSPVPVREVPGTEMNDESESS